MVLQVLPELNQGGVELGTIEIATEHSLQEVQDVLNQLIENGHIVHKGYGRYIWKNKERMVEK